MRAVRWLARFPRPTWAGIADTISRHPGRVVLAVLAGLAIPIAAVPRTALTYDVLSELPADKESVRGYEAIAQHYDRGQVSPLVVLVRHDRSLWDDAAFRAINDLTVTLGKIPGVATVRSLTQPTGGVFSEEDLASAGLEGMASFPDRLQEGADGVGAIIVGLEAIRGGLIEIRDQAPELAGGLQEAATGAGEMRAGVREIRDAVAEMRAGLSEAARALHDPDGGGDLASAAEAAADHAHSAFDELTERTLPTSRLDPAVQRAAEDAARAYGSLTGRDPRTGEPPPGDPGAARYANAGGLAGSLRTIAAGLRDAADGLGQIDGGLAEMEEALAQMAAGLDEGSAGAREIAAGAREMAAGLDRIVPGLRELRLGLARGAAGLRQAGFGDAATAGNLGLTPALVEAVPGLREQLGFFLSRDLRTARIILTLGHEPYRPEAINAPPEVRRAAALALRTTPLEDAEVLVGGAAAFFDDIRTISREDVGRIMLLVLGGIFLVLVIMLRSLVAPLYLIASLLLSFLAALGVTVLAFQGVAGLEGLQWWLPPFLFVTLIALGVDYNILLTSRIREEARHATTAVAAARGIRLTGPVIVSAGLILAGTFAALMAAPLVSLRQFGFAFTAGILIDTFVVRTLLVPAVAVLLGRYNWWPSARASAP